MIYTCSYKDFKTDILKGVSISGDRGKRINWEKGYYSSLAPKKEFFKIWEENKNKLNEIENNTFYIEEYYNKVLSQLDPEKVYNGLNFSTLLCYEDHNEFCHRHIVAAWLEIFLGITINEVKVNGLHIEKTTRKEYDFIKETLIKIIKKNTNMRGFNSIRALYLFNQGEKLEQLAKKLEEKNNKSYDRLYQSAAYLRSEADMDEEQYNKKILRIDKNEWYLYKWFFTIFRNWFKLL